MQKNNKNVPVYVYYVTVEKQKNGKDLSSKYEIENIVSAFEKMLQFTFEQELTERKINNKFLEKVIWLDSFQNLQDGNFNLVFKSAKYNHVRNEIDTENMIQLGQRKRPQDGDEEKTHLCIRLAEKQLKFLAIHESNHYGISIKAILDYFNEKFEKINVQDDLDVCYRLSYEIVPGETFINQLKKAKTVSVLKLEIDKEAFKDDFLSLAGRNDIKDSVEVIMKRTKGIRNFPDNLIRAYYDNMQKDSRIRSITVSGIGSQKNNMEISTDLIKMKHCISVECENITYEVNSSDFFIKAQEFINEMR